MPVRKTTPKRPPAAKTEPKAPERVIDPALPVENPQPAENVAQILPASAPQPLPATAPLSPGDERTWAMLAHLSVFLNLITGFFGPVTALIIYLIYKERSRYVAYHAMQAFINQLIWWVGGGVLTGIAWAVSSALTVFIVGFFLMPLACLVTLMPMVALVYGIVGGVQSSQGQDFKYWMVGDWTRRILTG